MLQVEPDVALIVHFDIDWHFSPRFITPDHVPYCVNLQHKYQGRKMAPDTIRMKGSLDGLIEKKFF